jgi:transcriptional regulator with XRE-family HTH domain
MEKTGTSRADFARLVGVDRAVVTRWMNGTNVPTVESLRRISKATGIKFGYLFEDAYG